MSNDINNSLLPFQPSSVLVQLKDTITLAATNFNKSSEKLQHFLINGSPDQQLQAAVALHNSDSCKDVIKQAELLYSHLSNFNSVSTNPPSVPFQALQHENTTASSHEIEISLNPDGPKLDLSLPEFYTKIMSNQRVQLISAINKDTNLLIKVHFATDVNNIMHYFSTQTYKNKKAIEYVNLKSTTASRNVIRVIGIPLPTLNPLLNNDPNYSVLKNHLILNNPHFFGPNDIISIQHYQSMHETTKEKKQSYTLKITITLDSFAKFLAKPEENTRIILNTTQSFKVYGEVVPSYCHQCLSFDHSPTCSQRSPQCRYCLLQHFSSACIPSKRTSPQCITCHRDNLSTSSSSLKNIEHAALSTFCPIYKLHRDTKRIRLKADARRNFIVTSITPSYPNPQDSCLLPIVIDPNLSNTSLPPDQESMET